MRKTFTYFLFVVISIVFVAGCGEKDLKAEDWLGRYTYSEPPVDGNITSWEILVNRLNGNYFSIINASNPTWNASYSCRVASSGEKLFVIYEKSLSKSFTDFHNGDTLVVLRKKGDIIETTWRMLKPSTTADVSKPCKCFSFRGQNENGNEISLP